MLINYVLTHKDFTWPVDTGLQIALADHEVKTNIPLEIVNNEFDNRVYGELYAWVYIYSQMKNDTDLYALNHYRRQLTNVYANKVNVVQAMRWNNSIAQQTAYFHSPTVVNLLAKVLKPEDFAVLNGNIFYPYNMFVVNRPVLKMWLDFVLPCIYAIQKEINAKTYEEVRNFVKSDKSFAVKAEHKNSSLDYQSRLFAFILERLNTIFWCKARGPIFPCSVKLLEENQTI